MQKLWLIGTDCDEDLNHEFVQSWKEYWNGSEWLSRPAFGWPPDKVDPNLGLPEENHQSIALIADAAPSIEDIYRRFYYWILFLRTVAYVRRWKTSHNQRKFNTISNF